MIYRYKCEKCNKEIEIIKSLSQVNDFEYCEKCNSILQRVYTASIIKTADGIKG